MELQSNASQTKNKMSKTIDFEFRDFRGKLVETYPVDQRKFEEAKDQARQELGHLTQYHALRVADLLGIPLSEVHRNALEKNLAPGELTYCASLGLPESRARELYLGDKLQILGVVPDSRLERRTTFHLDQGMVVQVRGHFMLAEIPFSVRRIGRFGNQASRSGGYWLKKPGSECSLKVTYSTLLQALERHTENTEEQGSRKPNGLRSFDLIRS